MRFGFYLLTLTLLAGCSGERRSFLAFVCPVGKPGYVQVSFVAPTGNWEFNGHALLHETIRTFSLHLPESPLDPARYSFERLQLIDTTPYPPVGVPLKGGHVAFSVERGTLQLELRTDKDEFWANGDYPFHIWGSNKLSCPT